MIGGQNCLCVQYEEANQIALPLLFYVRHPERNLRASLAEAV